MLVLLQRSDRLQVSRFCPKRKGLDVKARILLFVIVTFASGPAYSQPYTPVHVVQDLPGWQCMSLTSVYGPLGTNAPPVPVFAAPSSDSPQVGTGAGVIIVPKPLHPTNGRTEMIWPNGQRVWISVGELSPWRSLNDPKATCQPALLSNGRYGFRTLG